jgi:hypothetical protein
VTATSLAAAINGWFRAIGRVGKPADPAGYGIASPLCADPGLAARATITADTLVPKQLWQAIRPLLPTPPRRSGGRPRIDDRAALAGII